MVLVRLLDDTTLDMFPLDVLRDRAA